MKNFTMKKLLALTLTAAMSLTLLTSCGGRSEETPAPSADNTAPVAESVAPEAEVDYSTMTLDELKPLLQTVADGKLMVATSPDFAPAEFYAIAEDGTPTLAGHDVELAKFIAEYLGLELEMVTVDFDGVIMELQTKSVDLGIASFAADPKRANSMDFSNPYLTEDHQSFVCTQSNKDQFPTIEATNDAKYQFGAQTGSIQVDIAKRNSPNAEIVQLGKVTDIIAELIAGKLDGAYIPQDVATAYSEQYPELYVAMEVDSGLDSGTCIGVQKDNPVLLAAVNLAIKEVRDSGKMTQFEEEAEALALGKTYEGLLDSNGNVQE